MKIREAQNKDQTQILKLIRCLKDYESRFDKNYKTDEESVEKLFEEIKSRGSIFISENESKIVGFMSIEEGRKNEELIEHNIPVAYISDMAVLPEYRCQGIGKKLFQHAEDWAKKRGMHYLKLIVFSENINARTMYKNNGFTDYETTMLKDLTS